MNTSTGATVEEIDYDEFGNVTSDSAPGTIPFGFAGGLYDGDTGLVRFGRRDYDPSTGRWTAKDPIRFRGGMNLYRYAMNDPLDRVDLLGLDDFGTNDCSYYVGRCEQNGGSYYCAAAQAWCAWFPQGPDGNWTSNWAWCTRGCLQDCDDALNSPPNFSPYYDENQGICTTGTNETPDNSSPFTSTSNFGCHAGCYSMCAAFATGSMGALY